MLETEGASLAGRVHELERKVLEQGDEIVCLRATLADALRRLTLLENTKPQTPLHQRNGTTPSASTGALSSGHRRKLYSTFINNFQSFTTNQMNTWLNEIKITLSCNEEKLIVQILLTSQKKQYL